VTIVEVGKAPHYVIDRRLTPWQRFVSEALSTSVVTNVFYPFDVAQTLMQVNAEDAKDGIVPTLLHLYQKYGISAWFRGNVASNLYSGLLSLVSFLTKRLLEARFESQGTFFLGSFVSTEIVAVVLYPLQVAKTKLIANPFKYQNVFQTLATVHQEEGVEGLYSGVGFAFLDTIPTIFSSYLGYEMAGWVFRKPRIDLTAGENVAMVIIGTFLATMLHYPFETAKKKVQVLKYTPEGDSVLSTLANVGEKYGVMGLWKGSSAQCFKLLSPLLQRSVFGMTQSYFFKANGYVPPYYHPIPVSLK